MRHYCYLCDHIIAPSRPVAHIVARLQPAVPRTVLTTGIDVARASHQAGVNRCANNAIGPDDIVLLYVGRIVKEKDLAFC